MEVPIKLMFMSAAQIRAEIDSYLDQVKDENFLKVVHLMLNSYVKVQEPENDPIIGYDIEGNPKRASVMKELYDKQVKDAKENGVYHTIEEVEKEMETW